MDKLAREIDHLPIFPPGTYHCGADSGSRLLMGFAYRRGRHISLLVTLSGCSIVYGNRSRRVGDVTKSLEDRLGSLIELGY